MFTRSTLIKLRKSHLYSAVSGLENLAHCGPDCVSPYVTVSGQTLPDLISEFSFHVFFFFPGPFLCVFFSIMED